MQNNPLTQPAVIPGPTGAAGPSADSILMENDTAAYTSAFPAAGALTGAEVVGVLQGGVNKKTTAQDIADLGGGSVTGQDITPANVDVVPDYANGTAILSDTNPPTAAKWSVAAGATFGSGKVTFDVAAGTGDLTQLLADYANDYTPSQCCQLTYTVANKSSNMGDDQSLHIEVGAAVGSTEFPAMNCSNGTHTFDFIIPDDYAGGISTLIVGGGTQGTFDITFAGIQTATGGDVAVARNLTVESGHIYTNGVAAYGNDVANGNTGDQVVAMGAAAANDNTGYEVVAIGDSAAFRNTGSEVVAIGDGAAINNTFNDVLAMGVNATPTAANTAEFATYNTFRFGLPQPLASLPSAATVGAGARGMINDALAPAFGVAAADSGAVTVPVFSDGANWIVG